MPTLVKRSDGEHYVRHFYQQHQTWQIHEDAVACLHEFGFQSGRKFPTDIFHWLRGEGLVYIDSSPPRTKSRKPIPRPSKAELAEEKKLEKAIRDFHAAKNAGARRSLPEDFPSFKALPSCKWKIRMLHLVKPNFPFAMMNLSIKDKTKEPLGTLAVDLWSMESGEWKWNERYSLTELEGFPGAKETLLRKALRSVVARVRNEDS